MTTYAVRQYEKACELLPRQLAAQAKEIPCKVMAQVEEIRLRIGRPIHLVLPEGEMPILQSEVTLEDLTYVVDRATEFSRYSAAETLRLGFVTAEGGFRVGVCGTLLAAAGVGETMRDISSLSIRIPRVREGIARPLLPKLLRNGEIVNTLILSPPGGGKTTLLRDLVRLVSDGSEFCRARRVSLVDERGEIAAVYRGRPQLPVGCQTDVMDGCDKSIAVPLVLRAMSPQVIAVDEVAMDADVDALCRAANCGVVLLATAHAGTVDELRERPIFSRLRQCGIMKKAIVVEGAGTSRTYRVEEIG